MDAADQGEGGLLTICIMQLTIDVGIQSDGRSMKYEVRNLWFM
jgi:hypothetical protein